MTLRINILATAALFITTGVFAKTVTNVSVFATGAAVGATQPDSITTGDGSVWVEYGNGAVSTGGSGASTIVQYSSSGSIEHI